MSSLRLTAAADAWWAQDFACSPNELRPERTRVQAHAGALQGVPGIWILVAGGAPLVSLPSDVVEALIDVAQSWSVADVLAAEKLSVAISSVCPRAIEKIIGPAMLHYGSAHSLDLSAAPLACPFSEPTAIARLRAACSEQEWAHGGSDAHPARSFGVVDGSGELRALSGYEVWQDSLAHISIVTHPEHRGQGFGGAAVACAAAHALRAGLVPQYRALRQNTASLGIAKRLGFTEYGFSVYFRLRGYD